LSLRSCNPKQRPVRMWWKDGRWIPIVSLVKCFANLLGQARRCRWFLYDI
jgi:hypothetical protein